MKVYIAGPITNDPNYKEKFSAVAEKVKEIGLEPVNPAEAPEGLTYKEYIDRGLKLLMECDLICVINEDRKAIAAIQSKGTYLECTYAKTVGLHMIVASRTRSGGWELEIPRCWPGMFEKEAQ